MGLAVCSASHRLLQMTDDVPVEVTKIRTVEIPGYLNLCSTLTGNDELLHRFPEAYLDALQAIIDDNDTFVPHEPYLILNRARSKWALFSAQREEVLTADGFTLLLLMC